MMQDTSSTLLDILASQRNAALNELAKAQASLAMVLADNQRLTKELADKAGETSATPDGAQHGNDQPV